MVGIRKVTCDITHVSQNNNFYTIISMVYERKNIVHIFVSKILTKPTVNKVCVISLPIVDVRVRH